MNAQMELLERVLRRAVTQNDYLVEYLEAMSATVFDGDPKPLCALVEVERKTVHAELTMVAELTIATVDE